MIKNKLGKTNIIVNKIGFGGIPIQRVTKDEAKDLVIEAVNAGVNFFDTARGYTCSEEYLGNGLALLRDKVYIATKSMSRTYEAMKKDIEISLSNLQTSYLDLYQFHNVKNIDEWNIIISDDGAMKALLEAKEKGIILHIGVTSHSKDFLDWLLDSKYCDLIETIQYPLNFLEEEGIDLFFKAQSKNIGTIAMKPLGGGMIDNAEVAIKYLLRQDCLSVLIPGMGSIEELKINVNVKADDFTNEELEYIKKLKKEMAKEFCHRCGYCLPCTKGIDIPGVFTLEKYYQRYGLKDWAITRYNALKSKADSCINCGACLKRCPYQLNIPKKLAEIAKLFNK